MVVFRENHIRVQRTHRFVRDGDVAVSVAANDESLLGHNTDKY